MSPKKEIHDLDDYYKSFASSISDNSNKKLKSPLVNKFGS